MGAAASTARRRAGDAASFACSRAGGLRILHRPAVPAAQVLAAIEAHGRNAARGREHCEQWGPGSSVSRILLRRLDGDLDLAVKWNHPRGVRAAVSERLLGSRAERALRGAQRVAGLGLAHAEVLAVAERRAAGRVLESWLLCEFLAGSAPLPAAMPSLLADFRRRRAIADEIGRVVGTLHAAGLDHRDFKHSNLLVTPSDRVALLDLDSLVPPRRPRWRGRVRALGQLEVYTTDLYPQVPRSERARVLRAYFACDPALRGRRRELLAAARSWVERRLADWARRDRSDHVYFPLAPRTPLPPIPVDCRGGLADRQLEGPLGE